MATAEEVTVEIRTCIRAARAEGYDIKPGILVVGYPKQCCAIGSVIRNTEPEETYLGAATVLGIEFGPVMAITRGFDSNTGIKAKCETYPEWFDVGAKLRAEAEGGLL